MNYKNEQTHDWLLVWLVEDLDGIGKLDVVESAFGTPPLGNLEHAQRRKPFDIELTFENLSVVVETKVDSDESGRWNQDWQTNRIVTTSESLHYLKEQKEFLFITYGTSEFYTKPYKAGAGSGRFRHIGLNVMIDLVENSLKYNLPRKKEYQEWIHFMRIERDKRINAFSLLRQFSVFREKYLAFHGENDFPNNRFVFCAPELAFPVFSSLASEWNESERTKKFGKVSLYPVPRMSPPVHDSVLNFLEMWDSSKPHLGKSIFNINSNSFYLEINEDFNLNLKLDDDQLDQAVRDAVWRCLNKVVWPSFVNVFPRHYKQSTYVLFEFDFGFLKEVSDIKKVADQLESTIGCIVQAIA
ncbi:hypothetical protein [Desulfonatronovibrio magnus]|uniref:hypothetical protein n=1 Tax=Desulfonatronovibrio magnus TaxID=698827 RepID=UPI0005EADF7C|nr:hypothetical protein [Desulfonatronovibrio magnus]